MKTRHLVVLMLLTKISVVTFLFAKNDYPVVAQSTGTTERVSIDSNGNQANHTSHHNSTGSRPSISADGRYVAFDSSAKNLVGNKVGEQYPHAFIHDRNTNESGIYDEPGQIKPSLVSISSAGEQANRGGGTPFVSADSRYVTFWSDADHLQQSSEGVL